jgi:hypothetical protein
MEAMFMFGVCLLCFMSIVLACEFVIKLIKFIVR